MDKGIDASLGLDVALMTLQRLRKSGVLKAEVSHIPGVRGRGCCSIEIVDGKITSCIIEYAAGNRHVVSIEVVVSTNQKKGPFIWSYHPQASSQTQQALPGLIQASPAMNGPYQQQQYSPLPQQFGSIITGNSIPVSLVKISDLSLPNNLSANEKMILGWIFSFIDGQRTVADITALLPRLRFEDVKRGLFFLQKIRAITLMGE